MDHLPRDWSTYPFFVDSSPVHKKGYKVNDTLVTVLVVLAIVAVLLYIIRRR